MILNLRLRTAFNVLFPLAAFPCGSPEELYDRVYAMPWEKWIASDGYLSVVSSVNTPTITDWRFASLKVKDAIVDRIAAQTGQRPNSGPNRDGFVINLYWHEAECHIYCNTSGQKLSDRTYRRMPHKAPMQETLAAGVILSTGYDGSAPLINPMCGSGTLAIEAALIATRRPPGLLRSRFGFQHIKGFDESAWSELRRDAKSNLSIHGKAPLQPIIATDIDPKAIRAAEKNAETTGVRHMIEFSVCDFADTPIPDTSASNTPGIAILNPEYGERLGRGSDLESVYGRIGDFFKQNLPGWTGYIFTGNLNLAKKVGLRTTQRTTFFNAKIECRLLKYDLYAGTRKTTDSQTQPPLP